MTTMSNGLESSTHERKEDMSAKGKLIIMIEPNGDVSVLVEPDNSEKGFTSGPAEVEFCSIFGGGGRSPHTLEALYKLAVAIDKDNQESNA